MCSNEPWTGEEEGRRGGQSFFFFVKKKEQAGSEGNKDLAEVKYMECVRQRVRCWHVFRWKVDMPGQWGRSGDDGGEAGCCEKAWRPVTGQSLSN
jgi:hypothetical protein